MAKLPQPPESGNSGSDGSSSASTVSIIVGVLVGSLVLGIIATAVMCVVRRNRMAARPVYGRIAMNEAHLQELKQWEARITRERDKREEEIESTDKGERVWFSRHCESGRLKHWVIVVDGTKYELRRNTDDDTEARGRSEGTVPKYHSKTTKASDWEATLIKRQQALETKGFPEVDKFYICLIGWTKLTEVEIQEVLRGVEAKFGSYNLVWNNCQHFLQGFADGIVSQRATDWTWFREHVKPEYQADMAPPWPPLEYNPGDGRRAAVGANLAFANTNALGAAWAASQAM